VSLQNNSYQKQSPTLQERSPRQVLILPDRALLSVPCTTTTLYLLLLHWRLQRIPHARNVTLRLPCLAHLDYKHTSPPHPPLPSRRHTSLSARGEARVSMNPHPFQRRGSSVISGLNGPSSCLGVRNKDQAFGLRCVADRERSASRTKFNPGEHRPTFSRIHFVPTVCGSRHPVRVLMCSLRLLQF
jgi:hypothetical protein